MQWGIQILILKKKKNNLYWICILYQLDRLNWKQALYLDQKLVRRWNDWQMISCSSSGQYCKTKLENISSYVVFSWFYYQVFDKKY